MAPRDIHHSAKRIREHVVEGSEETNEEYNPSKFGGFREYFHNKMVKLQTQDRVNHPARSQLFSGFVVYITGFTEPSAPTLKRLIVENGGSYCSFLGGKTYATHIVAEALTSRKNEQFAEYKVVRPAWVVDCIAAGRVLDWTQYRSVAARKGYARFQSAQRLLEEHKGIPDRAITTDSTIEAEQEAFDEDEEVLEGDPDGDLEIMGDEDDKGDQDPASDLPSDPLGPSESNVVLSEPGDTSVHGAFHPGAFHPGEAQPAFSPTTRPHDATSFRPNAFCNKEPETEAEQRQCIERQRVRLNTLDPSFLPLYYARSRLHLLSTAKVALRQRCLAAMKGRPTIDCAAGPRIIMHVDFDSFFAAVALKKRPDLAAKPVCVSYGGESSDVASCNYVARAAGVRNGMWVGRAKEVCSDLVCLPYEFSEYKKASDTLYDILLNFGADYVTPVSIDEALVDVTTLGGASSALELAAKLRDLVRERTGLEVSVGAGPSILAAKIALKSAKPAGQVFIAKPDELKKLMAPLSIKDLPGVGWSAASKLSALAVATVGDLERFSRSDLESRLGQSLGSRLYETCRGIDTSDISSVHPPPRSFGVEVAWGVRLLSVEEVYKFGENLAADLWPRRFDLPAESLTVKLMHKAGEAPFVPPKYMGSGWCDATSRSRRFDGPVNLEVLQRAVRSVLRELEIRPLLVRGLGLSIRYGDPNVKKPPAATTLHAFTPSRTGRYPGQGSGSGGSSSSGNRAMVTLQPRRRRLAPNTLTQFIAHEAVNIDPEAFAALPSQIKREIMEHEAEFNVMLPDGEIPPLIGPTFPRRAEVYEPVTLAGLKTEAELRAFITNWVGSRASPFYEDVQEFSEYIARTLESDWDWLKAVKLHAWLARQVRDHNATVDWGHVVALIGKQVEAGAKA